MYKRLIGKFPFVEGEEKERGKAVNSRLTEEPPVDIKIHNVLN